MISREDILGMRRLASRANSRIKDWAGLHDRGNREALGLTIAEGARLVREGLQISGQESGGDFLPAALLVSDSGMSQSMAGEIFTLAGTKDVERYSLADDCFAKVSGLKQPDGLALVMKCRYQPVNLDELASREAKILLAIGVQDPGNAGALARTALAAGCTDCVFVDGVDPRSPKFLRGAMGAAFRMPCPSMSGTAFRENWKPSYGRLKAAVLEPPTDDYRTVDYHPPFALMIGGERGIPDEFLSLAQQRIHIPLQGGVESLNLAVAAGVILFEGARSW